MAKREINEYKRSGTSIIHIDTKAEKRVLIAECPDSEKAHFLATAANAYKEPENSSINQPEFDCLGKSQREGMPEPFVLIASDSLSPHLITLWAAIKKGDTASAVSIFSDIISDPGYKYRQPNVIIDHAKLTNACKIAQEMNDWRTSQGLEVFPVYNVA